MSVAVELQTTPCTFCGKPIVWAMSEKGKPTPLDPRPTKFGRYQIEDAERGMNTRYVTRRLTDEEMEHREVWQHRSHFAGGCKPHDVQQSLL